MAHFLLFYETAPDYLVRREPLRAEHLRLVREAHDRGEIVLAGALADPSDRAVLLFQGPDDSAAVHFAEDDLYVTGGLISKWEVRRWLTVVGEGSTTP